MSGNSTAQAVSAAGTVIGATAGLAGAIVTVGKIIGPVSANRLAVKGVRIVEEAEDVIHKKHNEEDGAGYIIPAPERTSFINETTTPLIARGVELDKATRTVAGSLRNYNETRKYYRDANFTHNDAQELSSRFQREHRRGGQTQECHADEGPGHNIPQQESYHPHYPFTNEGQVENGEHDHPPVNRNNTTASSQQSYSTARTSPPSASQRYTSGDVSESPVTFEGPSFANIQGHTHGSAQGRIPRSHRTLSPSATEQYQSGSFASDKKHTI